MKSDQQILDELRISKLQIGNFNRGVEVAAQVAESYGDQCSGGNGRGFVNNKDGERCGEVFYNLAESIRKAMLPLEVKISLE